LRSPLSKWRPRPRNGWRYVVSQVQFPRTRLPMICLLRLFRFVVVVALRPIIRSGLYVGCLVQKFEFITIGNWTFAGPASFIRIVELARDSLGPEDHELHVGPPEKFDVVYFPVWLPLPEFRYGCIPDAYVVWGAQGMLVGWVHLFNMYNCMKGGRWSFTLNENTRNACNEANKMTAKWLETRQFPTCWIDYFKNAC